jgi:hypothetical protein
VKPPWTSKRQRYDHYPHRISNASPEIKHYPQRISNASPEIKHQDTLLEEQDEDTGANSAGYRKWPTSWSWQLLVLIVRTFRQSRHVILSKLNLIQTILLAIITALIWFQVPEDERGINDRLGYVSM